MRLIDADILLKRIEQSKLSNPHTDIAFKRAHEAEHCHFLHMVIDMPTVEPKQGEWIGEGDGYADGGIVYDIWYCSNCDHCEEGEELALPNFCPNCGARMKGADDE